MQVATALKDWADHHEISRERAADVFGVTTRTWQRWTEGKAEPSPSQISKAEAQFEGLLGRIWPGHSSEQG